MKTLPIDITTFGFVEREYKYGHKVKNKCGRDFLYYVLNFYFPKRFNPNVCGPEEIDRRKLFGIPVPAVLAWTQIQFFRMPKFFNKLGLSVQINNKLIDSFFDFLLVTSVLNFKKYTSDIAIKEVELAIDTGSVVGIDISMGYGGLLDHVLFVYGYDTENLYVFDTHEVDCLEYEKITNDNRYIMKLPKTIVKKRWSRFGRVWIINRL